MRAIIDWIIGTLIPEILWLFNWKNRKEMRRLETLYIELPEKRREKEV